MNLVLLSGGSGQRLWPLSNDIRSKQFIKFFHREDGELESMVQRVYRQIKAVDTEATVTIATSKSQVSAIHNQLGEEVGISVEPCRRDTFPAIALAAAYLKDVQGVGEKESVVVCPVDPYAENDYFETLKALGDRAAVSSANLVLMGIEPTYPSEKYGYIIPIGKEQVSKVSMFKEKPTQEVAKDYIAKGALWNGGVFAFKLGYVLNRAHELIDFVDYEDLFNKYDTLTYRLYDYDRVGKDGKKRELHIDKALDVANLKSSAEPKQPLRVLKYRQGIASELLTRCKYFEVYRMIVNTERRQKVHYRADEIAFRVLLCVNGCGTISYEGGNLPFYKGDCIFVPADSEVLTIHGQAQFLDVRG